MTDQKLDVLVAEKVFGWTWRTEDADQPHAVPYLVSPDRDPSGVYYPTVARAFPDVYPVNGLRPYSTDIAAAFLVVEAMRARGWHVDVFCEPNGKMEMRPRLTAAETPWRVMFYTGGFANPSPPSGGNDEAAGEEIDPSLPRAICLAALRALGVALPKGGPDART